MDFIDQYLDGLCRTCLIEVDSSSYGNNTRRHWQSILGKIEECDTLCIAELLSTAVPQIQIQPSDELPKKICRECLQQLLSAYRFQQMCVQSEEQMRELVSTKHTEFKMSIMEAFKEHELERSDTDSKALETANSSSSYQNLEHPSIQKPLHEISVQITEDEAVQSSSLENINKELRSYNDEEGCFNEFIKNELVKDEDDTMHSTNSIECREEKVNLSRDEIIEPEAAQSSAADPLKSIDQLLEHCKDSQGVFSEFIINERIKEEDDTMHSKISIEYKEEMNMSKDEIIEPETTQLSAANQLEGTDHLPEHCKDSQAELSPFIKNEPIEDDELSIEYSDDDIIHSTISVAKEEVLAIESEEQQVNMRFSQRPYACAEYGKTFSTSSILAEQRTTKTEDKPYECPYCPLRFNSKSRVSMHKAIHEEAERHACDICGKDFKTRARLKTHKLIHEEKPHKCDFCEKRFTHMQQLKVHIRTHTGEKPFKCKYCEREFADHSTLNNHLRSHFGENIHRCKFCPLAFPSSAERRLHLTSHTNEDPEVREQNLKALQEEEAKLVLKFSKEKLSNKKIKQPSTDILDKAYECTYCTLRFTTNANKCSHEKMHEEVIGANVLSHKNEDPETRERNIKALREDEAELKQLISKEKTQQASTEKLLELKEYLGIYSNKPYECPYCPLRFRTKRGVREHRETHEGAKLGACDICGKKVRKRNLNVHKLTHREEKLHECDLCEKRFKSTLQLRDHRRRHAGEKRYKCKYCKRAYCQSSTLNLHLRTHLGDNIFRCEFCPLAFPSASERRLHLPSHKNEDPETRERNIKALQEDEARLKLQISTEKTQQPSTEESDQQLKHSIKHGEDMPYECPYCPLRFRTSYNLNSHKQIHEGVKREACDIYGKKMRKYNLDTHKLRAHSKVKPHKCDCCEMRFINSERLRVHMRTHTGEKTFKCRYCECAYYTVAGLKNHLHTHLGVNIYRCEFCPLAFPSASEHRLHLLLHKNEDPENRERNIKALQEEEAKLRLHISEQQLEKDEDKQHKLQTTYEYPYKCNICNKRFKCIENNRLHMRIHSLGYPFKCIYCEFAYNTNTALVKHLRTHLGDNVYRCEFCPLAFPSTSERHLHFATHKNEDPETRKRNIKALREAEAKLMLQISEKNVQLLSDAYSFLGIPIQMYIL